MTASETLDAELAEWPRWLLLGAILVVLPLVNAHVGFPYVDSRMPGAHNAWTVHRLSLIGAHVILVLLAVAWAARTRFDLRVRAHLPFGVGALLACMAAATFALWQKPLEPLLELQDYGSFSRGVQLLAVTSIVWAGFGQEVLFRSFAVPAVESLTGSVAVAVLITAMSFGYYHGGLSLGIGNLLANVAGGAILGVVFVVTRSTWAVVIPHAALVTVLLVAA